MTVVFAGGQDGRTFADLALTACLHRVGAAWDYPDLTSLPAPCAASSARGGSAG